MMHPLLTSDNLSTSQRLCEQGHNVMLRQTTMACFEVLLMKLTLWEHLKSYERFQRSHSNCSQAADRDSFMISESVTKICGAC